MYSLISKFIVFNFLIINLSYAFTLDSLPELVDEINPSVVRIEISSNQNVDYGITGDPFFDEFFKRQFGDNFKPQPRKGLGSGFIYKSTGLIVTNFHVIENADEIEIVLYNEKKYKANIVGTDKRTDVALLKINSDEKLKSLNIGKSENLKIGQWVVAIGNPLGLGTTVTTGIISAKGRYVDGLGTYVDFIQTDAALNKGNSGGPLFDLNGNVIGVNTAIAARGQGIGFAIPIDTVVDIVEQLRINGKVERGWLGVVIQSISPEIAESLKLKNTDGALVSEILDGSPALKSGLKRRDIIISVDGKKIKKMEELPRIIGSLKPKTKVILSVLRDGKKFKIDVILGSIPSENIVKSEFKDDKIKDSVKKFGFEVTNESFKDKSILSNVVVSKIYPDSPAASKLLVGDIIVEMNKKRIRNLKDFNQILSKITKKEPILFLIQRPSGGKYSTIYRSLKSN
ncbi:Do family serine endopeptidase [bacterium]|nr:Do family serine endopeptidase [bacterium]|tara:strand:+ start:108836 stop:110203 length:1368 start_codon:yes stop_codon:yes gene_type:complete